MKNEKLKILVFNVNWLGDVLFSIIAIKLLKRIYPDAYISCIVPPSCRQIIEGHPAIDEVITYDDKGKQKSLLAKLKFARLLRIKKFDKVFLFHRSFTRALIVFVAGIPERIGYYTRKRFYLLTSAIKAPDANKIHRADYYMYLVKHHEHYQKDTVFEIDFFIPKEAKIFVNDMLQKEGIKGDDFIIVLNPGGNWLQKRWPRENFSVLASVLMRDYDAKIVLSGSQNDRVIGEEIANLSGFNLVNLCGRMDLKQLAALMQRANIVISGDSGPLHLALSVGARAIGIFGPTSVSVTGPYNVKTPNILQKDLDCVIPCYRQGCSDMRCMKAVTVDDVVEKVREIITENTR